MPEDAFPDIVKTIKMVRQLQPGCLFRNRGIGAYGDFDTPEGSVPSGPRGDRERVWEAIDFIGGAWGWQPGDNYKSREWILGTLISETRRLRTAAFQSGKPVTVPTAAYFVRLPPRPLKPDVYLDDLKYILDPYGQIAPVFAACLWQPKVGKSYEGQALRLRGKVYAKGLGFRAPSMLFRDARAQGVAAGVGRAQSRQHPADGRGGARAFRHD